MRKCYLWNLNNVTKDYASLIFGARWVGRAIGLVMTNSKHDLLLL